MSGGEEGSVPAADPGRKRETKIRNERLKLGAAALDRASTVMLGGGVLGPLFQDTVWRWTSITWFVGAVVLHLAGQFVLGFIEEER